MSLASFKSGYKLQKFAMKNRAKLLDKPGEFVGRK